MKIKLLKKVRWNLVGLTLAAFLSGAGLASFYVYNQPATIYCALDLPPEIFPIT